jgi:hypothetical protein
VVVEAEVHRNGVPVFFFLEFPQQFAANRVVTVGEHVGLDHDFLADDPLDRVAPPVDLRAQRLDHHPRGRGHRSGIVLNQA